MTVSSLLSTTSVLLIAALLTFSEPPAVHPRRWSKGLEKFVLFIALAASALEVNLFPTTRAGTWLTGVAILGFALLPPLLGIVQRRLSPGAGIFRISATRDSPSDVRARFWGHMFGNLLGAVLVGVLLFLQYQFRAQSPMPLESPELQRLGVLLNIVLPLALLTVLSFARAQQLQNRAELPRSAISEAGGVSSHRLAGYSLREWHQLANVLYLTAALYLAAGSILNTFAGTVSAYHCGTRIPMSPWFALAISVIIAFLIMTGAQKQPEVYSYSIIGVPLVSGFALYWTSLFESSILRTIFICLLVFVLLIGSLALAAYASNPSALIYEPQSFFQVKYPRIGRHRWKRLWREFKPPILLSGALFLLLIFVWFWTAQLGAASEFCNFTSI